MLIHFNPKTKSLFQTPKMRVMQKKHNGFALVCCLFARTHLRYTPHLCILYAPPIDTIRPTPLYHTPHPFIPYALLLYTTHSTHLYHTPYSFIPHAPPIYTIRPTPLYHTHYSFILYALPIYTIYSTTYILYTPPLYAKKIINKAAKAR